MVNLVFSSHISHTSDFAEWYSQSAPFRVFLVLRAIVSFFLRARSEQFKKGQCLTIQIELLYLNCCTKKIELAGFLSLPRILLSSFSIVVLGIQLHSPIILLYSSVGKIVTFSYHPSLYQCQEYSYILLAPFSIVVLGIQLHSPSPPSLQQGWEYSYILLSSFSIVVLGIQLHSPSPPSLQQCWEYSYILLAPFSIVVLGIQLHSPSPPSLQQCWEYSFVRFQHC